MALASSIDPECRLICLALLSSASLFASAPFAAGLALAALALLKLEGVGIFRSLRDSAFIIAFALFTAAIRALGSVGGVVDPAALATASLGYGARLLAAYLTGRLFYASTSVSELRDASTRIVRRIPFVRRYDLGLSLSLVLGYIPQVFEEWRDSLEAARSRGMPKRASISMLAIFIGAFLRRLMLRAVALPQALSARGWSRDRGIVPSGWRSRDSLACLSCCLALAGALLRIV